MIVALGLLGACERPTRDPAKLMAIEAEARTLMRLHSAAADVPKPRWPAAITSVHPEFVSIDADGVHITTKAYFDGGWGYFVPRREGVLPEPRARFEEAGHGVYWWHPY